jgi:hypothetical protein
MMDPRVREAEGDGLTSDTGFLPIFLNTAKLPFRPSSRGSRAK